MPALIPHRWLEAWERAQAVPALERPTALLAALDGAEVAGASGPIEQCPLGRRDAALLTLREQVFGSEFQCLADCPQCRAEVEFVLRSSELRLPAPADSGPISVSLDGVSLALRLPNSADLAALEAGCDPAAARRRLFARCLLSATRADGTMLDAANAPDEWIHTAAEALAAADPQADLTFALCCPQCNTAWEAPFDVAAFFWQELQVWARRLLREVHELAAAYGWSEAEILSLPPARRRTYLELIRA